MAQYTWTYEIVGSGGGIKPSSPATMTIKRTYPTTSIDPAVYRLKSSTGSMSSTSTLQINANNVTVTFGSYGSISPAKNLSTHSLSSEEVTGISASLLNIGTSASYITVSETHGGSGNGVWMTGTTTFTLSVTVEDRYSPSTFSASNTDFSTSSVTSTSVVTITNAYLSELNHTVSWTCGTYSSGDQSVSAGVGTKSYSIPASWINAASSSTSASCTIVVKTYKSSTLIGQETKTIVLSVPASVKPSIGSVTAAVYNAVSGFSGVYIQRKTGATLTLANVSAGEGASIAANGYSLRMTKSETATFDSTNKVYTISTLANSGSITFYVSVTDSRGRTSNEVSATISVQEYDAPAIVAASAYRCRSNGVADENGTYACISLTASYTSFTGNSMTINSKYYNSSTPSTQVVAQNNMASGTSYIIGSGNLSASATYYVVFTVTDTVGSSATTTMIVQTAAYSIHIKNGGTGVAFGKTSEHNNSVEINQGWDLYYKGFITLPVIYSATTPANPVTGLVWLEPKQ